MVLYLIALLAAATIADSTAPQPNHGQPQLVSTTDGRVKRQMAEGGKHQSYETLGSSSGRYYKTGCKLSVRA